MISHLTAAGKLLANHPNGKAVCERCHGSGLQIAYGNVHSVAPEGRGATYVDRQVADGTVEMLASGWIIAEVVRDGKCWRLIVHPERVA
jgi:hypothetical protein